MKSSAKKFFLLATVLLLFGGDGAAEVFELAVVTGWNLVSVPLEIDAYSLPDGARIYDYFCGCYIEPENIEPGRGIWLYMPADGEASFSGVVVSTQAPVTVRLNRGWNLVGSPFAESTEFNDALTIDGQGVLTSNVVESDLYTYNGYEYVADTRLRPGRAHWIKVGDDCILSVPYNPPSGPDVTASVAPAAIMLLNGQASAIVFCQTSGDIEKLEAKCSIEDQWHEIPGEDSYQCVYSEPGVHAPGCRVNESVIDYANPAVNVAPEPEITVSVSPLWTYISDGQAWATLTCEVDAGVTVLEGRCLASGQWVLIEEGNALQCAYTEPGSYIPACRIESVKEEEAPAPVLVETEPELTVEADPVEITIDQGVAETTVTCDADGTIFSWEIRCDSSLDWTPLSVVNHLQCIYTNEGEYHPWCRLNGVMEGQVEIPVAVHAEQTVTATASPVNVILSGGQAQIALTCNTTGVVEVLEGRCELADDWTSIDTGSDMTCIYTTAGVYTPGCRMNSTLTDDVDAPVTVTEQATVTAQAAPTQLTLSGGQAVSTLTCVTTGSVSQLWGKCKASSSWSQLMPGNTLECAYTAPGTYAPSCLLNQVIFDEVDTAVTVESGPPTNRIVMIEAFANQDCPHCQTSIPELESAMQSFGDQTVLLAVYHISDSYEAPESYTRRLYYGVSAVPTIFANGTFIAHGGDSQYYIGLIQPYTGDEDQIFMTVQKELNGNVIDAVIDINYQGDTAISGLVLRTAVVQDLASGGYHYLVRDMLAEQNFNLDPGEQLHFELSSGSLSGTEQSFTVIAFLQKSDKEIIQAARD